jgi:undecaprenyl-diphosphatase
MINLISLSGKISVAVAASDQGVNALLSSWRSANLNDFFLWLTSFGGWPIIISGAAILTLLFWLKNKKTQIIPFWLALGGANLTSTLGKLYFARIRPSAPVYWENTFSFPSGHAINAIFLYGFMIYFLAEMTPRRGQKILIGLAGILIILAVGFSRLYLGVHYLSDVISGYIVGALWLFAAIRGVKSLAAAKK